MGATIPVPEGPIADTEAAAIGFAALGAPTGDPVRIGLIISEGTPGLDFPEISVNITPRSAIGTNTGGLAAGRSSWSPPLRDNRAWRLYAGVLAAELAFVNGWR